MTSPSEQPSQRQPSALEIAHQWAQYPPAHLTAAIKALEPQLRREHELLQREFQLREEELRQIGLKEHHSYVLYMVGAAAGFAIAIGSIAGAIMLGPSDPTLAGILLGPGLASVIFTFVLRRPPAVEARRPGSSKAITAATLQGAKELSS